MLCFRIPLICSYILCILHYFVMQIHVFRIISRCFCNTLLFERTWIWNNPFLEITKFGNWQVRISMSFMDQFQTTITLNKRCIRCAIKDMNWKFFKLSFQRHQVCWVSSLLWGRYSHLKLGCLDKESQNRIFEGYGLFTT